MQTSSPTPHAVVKQKKFWFPKINTDKIAKFIKDAYFWDEEHEKPATQKTKG